VVRYQDGGSARIFSATDRLLFPVMMSGLALIAALIAERYGAARRDQ